MVLTAFSYFYKNYIDILSEISPSDKTFATKFFIVFDSFSIKNFILSCFRTCVVKCFPKNLIKIVSALKNNVRLLNYSKIHSNQF